MFFRHFQRAVDTAITFLRNQSGSILIYTGAFMAVGVGGAALSIDIGRIVLLKTQMQNRADAGALAGAAQLDAQTDAIVRATKIIADSMTGYTTAAADQGELAVWYSKYYVAAEDKISRGAETLDDDALARFAQVVMERRTLSFFYGPALNILTGQSASNQTYLDASAVGMSDPFICKMQPLMICDPYDDGIEATVDPDITDSANRGFGLRLKSAPSSGAWQPGNFGLLQLPEDADYTGGGAVAVKNALASEDPLGCYAVSSLTTATGTPVASIINGINVRWTGPASAPNVMNYPRDNIMTDGYAGYDVDTTFGDGVWDLDLYWNTHHAGTPMPSDLVGTTRYLIYLFEQGIVFWAKNGGKTIVFTTEEADAVGGMFPVDVAEYIADPTNYPDMETVAGSGNAIPVDASDPTNNYVDGIPPDLGDISYKGQERRVVKIAVAKCAEESFQGISDLPADGVYLELFLTEEATSPAAGAEVYGEIIRNITANTSLEFHGNVRLVE